MNTYDTIFFDIGNTLFFYNYDFLREFLEQRFGLKFTTAELHLKHEEMKKEILYNGAMILPHDELWWAAYRLWLTKLGVEEEKIRPISEAIKTHPFNHLFWSKMEEGTREMLNWFRERGFKLGVISNAEGQIRRLIEYANLTDHFDVIADSGVLGFAKPDKRIFAHAMDAVGASPLNSIHVGDIFDVDVLGAKSAGITPVFVDPQGRLKKEDCLTVKRVLDLPKLSLFKGL